MRRVFLLESSDLLRLQHGDAITIDEVRSIGPLNVDFSITLVTAEAFKSASTNGHVPNGPRRLKAATVEIPSSLEGIKPAVRGQRRFFSPEQRVAIIQEVRRLVREERITFREACRRVPVHESVIRVWMIAQGRRKAS